MSTDKGTKPTSKTLWTDGQPGNRIEPTGSEKDQGYTYGESPAAKPFNWLLWILGQWSDYLEKITDYFSDKISNDGTDYVEFHADETGQGVKLQSKNDSDILQTSLTVEKDGDLKIQKSIDLKTVSVSSSGSGGTYNAGLESVILADADTANLTINLPSATILGRIYKIKAVGITSPYNIQISGGDIDGNSIFYLQSLNESVELVCDGVSSWKIIARNSSYPLTAVYNGNLATIFNPGTTIYSFQIKIIDTHGTVTYTPWKFTAPLDGFYSVNAHIALGTISWSFGDTVTLSVYVNGSFRSILKYFIPHVSAILPNVSLGGSSIVVYLSKTDYLDFRVSVTGVTSPYAKVSPNGATWCSIHKLGD